MAGRRRAIIICHPDFDKPGKEGVQDAKQFAEQLLVGQKQIIELAEKNGEDPETIRAIRSHVAKFLFRIRNLDEDIL